MADLKVNAHVADGRPVLRVSGDLDLATLASLRTAAEAALAACGDGLVLDLTELTFVDSSGLGLLVELRNRALAQGGTLQLQHVPSGPKRVIEIAGLAETFGVG